MRITKSRAYKDSERVLSSANTQQDVDNVVKAAKQRLKDKEFGHFLKKVLDKRRELPERP